MADQPEKLEQISRTHHSSNSGIDITRTFYCEPYHTYPEVTALLQGSVAKNDEVWKRTPPLRDTIVKNCYCDTTRVDFADQDAMASADSLETGGGTIKDKLQKQAEKLQAGTAGCKILAHYRPLITAWQPTPTDEDDEDADPPEEVWDWLDPIFEPGIKLFPWPAGLHVAVDSKIASSRDIGTESSPPLAIPVTDITIKRILVGEVPWGAISNLAEVINEKVWPVQGSPAANGLGMSFPARTLKFIDAEVTNMIDARGVRWHQIILHFKWLHYATLTLHDNNGKLVDGGGNVTWDHQFMRPNGFPVGWYEVFRNGTLNLVGFNVEWVLPGQAQLLQEGNLHIHGTFDDLFKLNP